MNTELAIIAFGLVFALPALIGALAVLYFIRAEKMEAQND